MRLNHLPLVLTLTILGYVASGSAVWSACISSSCNSSSGASSSGSATPATSKDAAAPEIVHHQLPSHERLQPPFSSAVQVGDLLFLSGAMGNPPGKVFLVDGGIEAETRQAMDNLKLMVESFGSSMDRVAKCTVYLADIKEWSAMSAIYRTYFPADKKPARMAFQGGALPLGARVEVDCIAVVD